MPRLRISGFVTNTSSPTSWTLSPSSFVSSFQPVQSLSATPSSIEMIGYWRAQSASIATISSMLRGRLARLLEDVAAVVPHFARRHVEREEHVAARLVAGVRDRFEHQVERLAIRFQARREAAFVADAGRQAALLQRGAQRVKDLRARAQRFGEASGRRPASP